MRTFFFLAVLSMFMHTVVSKALEISDIEGHWALTETFPSQKGTGYLMVTNGYHFRVMTVDKGTSLYTGRGTCLWVGKVRRGPEQTLRLDGFQKRWLGKKFHYGEMEVSSISKAGFDYNRLSGVHKNPGNSATPTTPLKVELDASAITGRVVFVEGSGTLSAVLDADGTFTGKVWKAGMRREVWTSNLTGGGTMTQSAMVPAKIPHPIKGRWTLEGNRFSFTTLEGGSKLYKPGTTRSHRLFYQREGVLVMAFHDGSIGFADHKSFVPGPAPEKAPATATKPSGNLKALEWYALQVASCKAMIDVEGSVLRSYSADAIWQRGQLMEDEDGWHITWEPTEGAPNDPVRILKAYPGGGLTTTLSGGPHTSARTLRASIESHSVVGTWELRGPAHLFCKMNLDGSLQVGWRSKDGVKRRAEGRFTIQDASRSKPLPLQWAINTSDGPELVPPGKMAWVVKDLGPKHMVLSGPDDRLWLVTRRDEPPDYDPKKMQAALWDKAHEPETYATFRKAYPYLLHTRQTEAFRAINILTTRFHSKPLGNETEAYLRDYPETEHRHLIVNDQALSQQLLRGAMSRLLAM